MAEWLKEEMEIRRPKIEGDESLGKLQVFKVFSRTKERQVVGGRVTEGKIALKESVKIIRRDFEVGKGKIVNLEKNKVKTSEVESGSECGLMVEAKIEIAQGDILECFKRIER